MNRAPTRHVPDGRWHPSLSLLSLAFALIGALVAALIWIRIPDAPPLDDSRTAAVTEASTEPPR